MKGADAMDGDDQVMYDEALQDPSELSPQERTNQLVKNVEEDDLLAVLVVLNAMSEDEINATASDGGLHPLEAAIVVPTASPRSRQLVVEVLLLSGANPAFALPFAQQTADKAMEGLLQSWKTGGSDMATTARHLLEMEFEHVEEWIEAHLGDDGGGVADGHLGVSPAFSPSSPPSPRPKQIKAELEEVINTSALSPGPPPRELLSPSVLAMQHSSPDPSPSRKPSPQTHLTERATPSQGAVDLKSSPSSEVSSSAPPSRRRSSRSFSPRRAAYSNRPCPRSPSPGRPVPAQRNLPPPPSAWIYVDNIPVSVGPRYIYEVLRDKGISVEDIYMQQSCIEATRFAFVGVRSQRAVTQAIEVLDRRHVEDRFFRARLFHQPKTGASAPDLSAHEPRCRYLGPSRNAQFPPYPSTGELYFSHMSAATTPRSLIDFLEGRLGRGCARSVHLVATRNKGERSAVVDLAREADRLFAITHLDGVLLDHQAITVNWFSEPSPPRRSSFSPTRHRTPSYPHHTAGLRSINPPTRLRLPGPATSAGKEALPSKNSEAPSVLAADDPDLARLRTLNLPQHTLNAIQRLWRPLSTEDLDSTASFSRSAKFDVDFGFLPKREANLALDANAETPAYADEPEKQKRYEAFLKAQAGNSKDWFLTFFAKLAEFNRTAAAFADKGRAASSAPPPPAHSPEAG
ncbi:hypothetical protein JCM11251_000188 [Rhodosporidiobolus azoricus]